MRGILLLSALIFLIFPSFIIGGYKEDFEREFLTKPWAGEQVEESACIGCHRYKIKPRDIPEMLQTSMHFQNGVSCHDCHGGDPKDASMAMAHERGFVGAPQYAEVPEFCGKCHIGILKQYVESGHGKALESTGKGPNCVTCHGSHKDGRYIQLANINIINEQLCTKCHSYERAKDMKQALFLVEKKMDKISDNLKTLKKSDAFVDHEEKELFSAHAEFRALFHSTDVTLVKSRTDEFTERLHHIELEIQSIFKELRFRRNFSAFFMLLFAAMAVMVLMLPKSDGE
jgi:hypothetical protein